MAVYPDDATMGEARRLYFDANGFGDGGYTDKWVKLKAGPIPIWFPNSAQRIRSVQVHDLHHIVTGYDTDWTGEAEIGAWEIASSCRDHWAAWVLNLEALGVGLLIAPAAMWRAFLRGRRTLNLYDGDLDPALLGERVGAMRTRLRLDLRTRGARFADRVAFAIWSVSGLLVLVATALVVLGLPVTLLVRLLS